MQFPSDPALEARVGRACLVFARVEQEAGHVLQAADGDWNVAGSTAYLDYSSMSRALDDQLKVVGSAHPELQAELTIVRQGLGELKSIRDAWAHSADVTDLFILLRELGATHIDLPDPRVAGRMLNSKRQGHFAQPTDRELENFVAAASALVDRTRALARRVA